MGESDLPMEPQDVTHTATDLESALAAANITPPYVLVGHSIGSFETLMFAYRYPADVAGIVLVDPSSPHQIERFALASPKFGEFNRSRLSGRNEQLRKCIAALRANLVDDSLCNGDMQPGTTQQRLGRALSALGITENIGVSSDALDEAKAPLGDIPIIILTAGQRVTPSPDLEPEMDAVSDAWTAMHRDLAALSPKGERRVVEGARHYIHRDRPNAVVQAIREVVEQVRGWPVSR